MAAKVLSRDIFPAVMEVVSGYLSQRDICSLLGVSPSCRRALLSQTTLWQIIDLREMNRAGNRLISAVSLPRYRHVKTIILEFSRDVEDKHLILLKSKGIEALQGLRCLNLNGCQKISDNGIEAITGCCPNLMSFSIYWNVRVGDRSIMYLAKNSRHVIDLNLSGCKYITDESLHIISKSYKELKVLNLTRCVDLTDEGLEQLALKCSLLENLNLYALSSFTDKAYIKIAGLRHLKYLDLCGAQNLSDNALQSIAGCSCLVALNLTWCVRITDVGIIAIAQGCRSLELLSLFGIVGVTDACLDILSEHCSGTLTTLDVNGCIGIKRRSKNELLQLFSYLKCFKVHS